MLWSNPRPNLEAIWNSTVTEDFPSRRLPVSSYLTELDITSTTTMRIYISVNTSNGTYDVGLLERCTDSVYAWPTHNSFVLNPFKIWSHAIRLPTCKASQGSSGRCRCRRGRHSSINCCKESRCHPRPTAHIWQVRCSSLQCMLYSHPCLASHQKSRFQKKLLNRRLQHTQFVARQLAAKLIVGWDVWDETCKAASGPEYIGSSCNEPQSLRPYPVLDRLNWLPIGSWIMFKIAKLTYKIRESDQLTYLASFIPTYVPEREIRSSKEEDMFPAYVLEREVWLSIQLCHNVSETHPELMTQHWNG